MIKLDFISIILETSDQNASCWSPCYEAQVSEPPKDVCIEDVRNGLSERYYLFTLLSIKLTEANGYSHVLSNK